ncbi:MAG: hypothetical protein A3A44_00200 [Candidatus Sungbacteria bacterium RIFCSPLOWO2_01_FULL_60_25]|uniref:LamG-like jellyroll fold domain-containing protein n=1 Tax=Candidatus Sungbacteria bacterium RIFCSPLOWO2_01_FULL_60_25 TaxID=1802281 RepID=A0A1G2LA19_9BACT|nr:MAG: hypothetical protein A3A44_00200 [Candidatus Sungbacteria bacterium RIFCSPLOWO2_01_FULL_60_25]
MTLLLVVLLLAMFLSIAAGIFQIAFTEYRLAGELSDSFRALYAADEGVERLFFYDRFLDSVLGCPPGSGFCDLRSQTINFGNGICVELQYSRSSGGEAKATAIGEFRCGGSPVAVRRALEATYQKESGSSVAPVAFWPFDWGTGESANPQPVEDVVQNDNRTAFEPNDGMRGASLLGVAFDPNWVNPNGGACAIGGNCALKFRTISAVREYVRVPEAGDGSLDPGEITIAAWVRITATPSSNGDIVAKGNSAGYRFRINNSSRTVTWFGGAANSVSSAAAVPLDTWTHIAVTGDSSGLKIYINGSPDGSNAAAYASPNTAEDLYIGAAPDLDEYFRGCIDNVKLWNTALSADEVGTDYASYVPGTSC